MSTIVEVVFVSLSTASADRLLTLYKWNRFPTGRRFFKFLKHKDEYERLSQAN